MKITNRTESRKGITLSTGVLLIESRKSAPIPRELEDEVKALFKSATFQRFVDTGIFSLTGMKDDDESVNVETPAPPADLAAMVDAGVQTPVGTETGSRAQTPVVVEHQTGGSVAVETSKAKAKK
jgi:hypothetical protein